MSNGFYRKASVKSNRNWMIISQDAPSRLYKRTMRTKWGMESRSKQQKICYHEQIKSLIPYAYFRKKEAKFQPRLHLKTYLLPIILTDHTDQLSITPWCKRNCCICYSVTQCTITLSNWNYNAVCLWFWFSMECHNEYITIYKCISMRINQTKSVTDDGMDW